MKATGAQKPAAGAKRQASQVKTLIVDDQEPFLDALRRLIAAVPGFVLAGEASSGEDALAMVDEVAPQLVLMDVRMPGMGGFEAALRIRESGRNPKVQVVFVTSRTDDEFRDQAGRAGAAAYITKPFVVSEITLTALAFTLRARISESSAEPAEPAIA